MDQATSNRSWRPSLQPLPPPPSTANLTEVLPYLAQLALSEKQLYWRLGLAMICIVGSKAAALVGPWTFKLAIDALSASVASVPLALTNLALYGLASVVQNLLKEVQGPIFTPVSQAVARRVAYHTFSHVLNLDISFHLERRTGRLSRILERGTRAVQMLYRALIFTLLPTFVNFLFVCSLLGSAFSPAVALCVGATFVAYVAWSVALTQAAVEVRKRVNQLDNQTSSKAIDALLNYETVALFNNQKLEIRQYDRFLKDYQTASIKTEQLSATLNAGQAVILAVGLTAILMAAILGGGGGGGGAAAAAGTLVTAGDLVMIQGLLLQLWAPLQFLGWFYRELRQSLIDMEEFFQILQTRSNLKDGTRDIPTLGDPSQKNNGVGGVHHNGVDSNGHIDAPSSTSSPTPAYSGQEGLAVNLQDVKFGYTAEREVLKGASLRVNPGESVAVVGPSGSGKSTILKLVTRLYDVREGQVLINGVDVRDVKQDKLRAAVAVVPQDTVLFNDTILENIRYGFPEATDDQVIEAAKAARLHQAVMRMPKKYETEVGERGLKLSGGEKQRVAIARAFLRSPRLLICDEATSALDSGTERAIMASLNDLAKGRSCIYVAHRLSTIKNCDRIVVLSEGHVAEEGRHDELMALGGIYREIWDMQVEEAAKRGEADQGGVTSTEEEEDVREVLVEGGPVEEKEARQQLIGAPT